MSGRTVSAYADEETAEKVAEMARLEDRSPAQIAAAALRLYVRLPAPAREAWRRLEADLEPGILDAAAWEAGRALLDRQFDAVVAALSSGSRGAAYADEEAILAHAVRVTKAP
jgi:predicted transcriptional regulator